MQWYLYDGYIVGAQETIRKALEILECQTTKPLGLHLQMSKCPVLWLNALSSDDANDYPQDLKQLYTAVTHVLRTPVGHDDCMGNRFPFHVASLSTMSNELPNLQDTHVSVYLLRASFGIFKVNHLIWMVPHQATSPGPLIVIKWLTAQLENSLQLSLIRVCSRNCSCLPKLHPRTSPRLGSDFVQL